MNARLLAACAAIFVFVGLALPGHAETGCSAADSSHDIAPGSCETVLTFTAVIAGEPVSVTVVADSSLGVTPHRAGEIRMIIDRTAVRLSEMALTGFPDITIALADGLAADAGDADGVTSMVGRDCLIALSEPSLGTDTGLLRHTTAHEVFHCAQYALQPRLADLVSAAWWSEGSAEWFANWVYQGTSYSAGYVSQFDADSVHTPVTGMDYPAAVFFAWYGQVHGPTAVADFIRGLTGSADDLASAVGESGWQAFADAYFDRAIRWPGGFALPSTPDRGPSHTFADSTMLTMEAERYLLYRADLVFEAGYWSLENEVEAGRYDVGEGGEQLPDAIETECEQPTRLRLHGGGVGADGFRLTVYATLDEEAVCTGCIEAPAFDRCLVGTWQFSAGGPVEWLRRQMGPDVAISMNTSSVPSMTFYRNGSFDAAIVDIDGVVSVDEGYGSIIGSIGSGGRWSTSDGTLHICEDTLNPNGTVTVEVSGFTETSALASMVGPGTMMSLDYSCSGDLLITELRFPGITDPMVTNYTRAPMPGD